MESDRFASTHWTQVLAAGSEDSEQARAALAQICQGYWYPLYAYLRHRGLDEDEAKDVTQGFFEHLLANREIAKADPARGRFRSFLLKSLQHYLANRRRDAERLKRGGGQAIVSLDDSAETRYRQDPGHDLTPDKLYERRWAMAVIAQALRRLREDYSATGQASLYEALAGTLTGAGGQTSLAETGRGLGLSEGAVKVAAHRLRKRFGRALRGVILDTVGGAAEVDVELGHLQAILQEGLTTITLPSQLK